MNVNGSRNSLKNSMTRSRREGLAVCHSGMEKGIILIASQLAVDMK